MIKFSRTLSDEEQKILEHDILDIAGWINGMIDGKINNCTKRLAQQRRADMIAAGATTVPAKDIDIARHAFADVAYKNRAQREAESVTIKSTEEPQ